MQQIKDNILIEACNHCGKDVSRGSGKYVNRIPDGNDVLERIENGLEYPWGDFICGECDEHFEFEDE
jgi:hypothetical protein